MSYLENETIFAVLSSESPPEWPRPLATARKLEEFSHVPYPESVKAPDDVLQGSAKRGVFRSGFSDYLTCHLST